jgi:hypothetical protein
MHAITSGLPSSSTTPRRPARNVNVSASWLGGIVWSMSQTRARSHSVPLARQAGQVTSRHWDDARPLPRPAAPHHAARSIVIRCIGSVMLVVMAAPVFWLVISALSMLNFGADLIAAGVWHLSGWDVMVMTGSWLMVGGVAVLVWAATRRR